MDEDSTNIVNDLRKLRKKLRQIENLERLDRPLNYEEKQKVSKKGPLRASLQEILKLVQDNVSVTPETSTSTPDSENSPSVDQSSVPSHQVHKRQPESKIHQESYDAKMKRNYEELDPGRTASEGEPSGSRGSVRTSPKRAKEDEKAVRSDGRGDATTTPKKDSGAATKSSKSASQKPQPRGKTELEKKRETWSKMKFSIQDLEGHNDLITSLDCKDNTILSGSRDTTVKAWDRTTGTEKGSLGGHGDAVTSVYLLTADENRVLAEDYDLDSSRCHLALSSSRDCSVRLWDLDASKELRSIYTFNPVTAMAYMSSVSCAVTGSDGGKVELWDVATGDSAFSSRAHDDVVSCIKVKGERVATASSDGVIKLWELRERSLHVIFESENIRSQSGILIQRPILSLGLANNFIYYGDDGTNVKILDWQTGNVRKLRNHPGDFGSIYSMQLSDDILLFASYDLDNGVGAINFFNNPDHKYLATLCDSDMTQIEAISSPEPANPSKCFVTAGQELRIWRSVPANQHGPGDIVSTMFDLKLTLPAEDSDDESSDSELSGDEVFMSRGLTNRGSGQRSRRRGNSASSEPQQSSWGSWCSLL